MTRFIGGGELAGIFDVEGVGDRFDDKGDTSGTTGKDEFLDIDLGSAEVLEELVETGTK